MWRMSARTVSKDPRRTDLRVRMLNHASTRLSPLRGEMELHPRMSGQPRLHRRRRMRGRVVLGTSGRRFAALLELEAAG